MREVKEIVGDQNKMTGGKPEQLAKTLLT